MTVTIRLARTDETEPCREIQRRSGEIFLGTAHAHIADDEPDDPAILRAALAGGLLWAAVDIDDTPIGQLTAAEGMNGLIIAQLDVLPEYHRRGIGRMLIEAAEAETRRRGLQHMWLRTFRDVPWNAPYYERLGFQVLNAADSNSTDSDSTDPDLIDLAMIAHERGIGLDPAQRVTMRKDL